MLRFIGIDHGRKPCSLLISIHLMLRFIIGISFVLIKSLSISIHLMLRFIAFGVDLMELFNDNISIHLMLRFIIEIEAISKELY